MKTHTFRLGKYQIECARVMGCTDRPDTGCEHLRMIIPPLERREDWRTIVHEAMEAHGCAENEMHDKDGYPITDGVADFLWRVLRDSGGLPE